MPEQPASTRWTGAPSRVAPATCSGAANRFGPRVPGRVLLGSQLGRGRVRPRCLPRRGARQFARATACPSEQGARSRPQSYAVQLARHRMCLGDGQPIRRQFRAASILELIIMVRSQCAQSGSIAARRSRWHGRRGVTTNAAPDAASRAAPLVTKHWGGGNV